MSDTKRTFTLKVIIQLLIVVVIVPLLPLLISGAWDWWEAWVYGVIGILGFVVSRALAAKRHPDILAERARSMEMKDAKPWDKFLAPVMALGSVIILIVAGLDKLFGWTSPFSLPVKLVALILILFGFVLGSWALMENRFFSGVVRIQTDRGHYVVTTGPYRFVRHPGYVGALWSYLAMPIFLNSLWAFIPTGLLVIVIFLRTYMEDKTLQTELPGYKEFSQKTKYRLLPGIW
ncbi:MAG: isoprenylcysteine carboxylmethyltransferase family protein [Anaerolineae bacterium]|nr:isoprenylcysteine carboxylmethyltransferase family protein [Anaerolineae bacterium]